LLKGINKIPRRWDFELASTEEMEFGIGSAEEMDLDQGNKGNIKKMGNPNFITISCLLVLKYGKKASGHLFMY